MILRLGSLPTACEQLNQGKSPAGGKDAEELFISGFSTD